MNDEIIEVAIKDIQIGRRFRKDFGDLEALARQIERGELLQPIGLSEDLELVFGERRLRAYRDILKRDTILARIISPASVELAQIDENVERKDFTISEKVEIVEFLRGFQHGGDRRSHQARKSRVEKLTIEEAVKRAGFKSVDAHDRAKRVVDDGVPELVKAMEDEEISISAAAELASLRHDQQRQLLADRRDWTAGEIASIKRHSEMCAGGSSVTATPIADGSVELEEATEGEPTVPFGMVPVIARDQNDPVGSPAGLTDEGDGSPDDEEDEATRAEEGSDDENFYSTPRPVTEALLEVEEFGSSVWEPACGDGAISKVLIKHGYEVASFDIVDRGYGAVDDFFGSDRIAECIVTHPDNDNSEKFVRMALEKTTHKVAILLPLSFLASPGNYNLFRRYQLKCVYVFTGGISIYSQERQGSRGNEQQTYAWFVWQHGYEGDPTIHQFHPDICDETDGSEEDRPRPKHPARQVG